MTDRSKYARRLLAAAFAYREWEGVSLSQWAVTWRVDPDDLREVVLLPVRKANSQSEEDK